MYKESGFAYQLVILVVIIVIAISGVLLNKIIGKDGVVEKVVNVENNYNKEDVLEKINFIITQKFVELNKQAKDENKVISEIYNSNIVIDYLKQSNIIEEIYDLDGNIYQDIYLINIEKLNSNETKNYYKSGKFQLEKIEEKYIVTFINGNDEKENIGELQIQQV